MEIACSGSFCRLSLSWRILGKERKIFFFFLLPCPWPKNITMGISTGKKTKELKTTSAWCNNGCTRTQQRGNYSCTDKSAAQTWPLLLLRLLLLLNRLLLLLLLRRGLDHNRLLATGCDSGDSAITILHRVNLLLLHLWLRRILLTTLLDTWRRWSILCPLHGHVVRWTGIFPSDRRRVGVFI